MVAVSRVLILCATEMEMAVFLDRNPPAPVKATGPGIFSGPDQAWDLIISGPGVFNAVCALTRCLERCRPELILHTGIAGVFDGTGLDLGDAAVAVKDTYLHAGVDTGACSGYPDPLPFDLIEGQAATRQGVYELDGVLAESHRKQLARSLPCRVIQGPFITVSSITGSFEKAAALSTAFSPVMESMEGAAAAHVSALYRIPMVEIRAASNRVGERCRNRWDMDRAVKTVADICDTVLKERG